MGSAEAGRLALTPLSPMTTRAAAPYLTTFDDVRIHI
jgi:hypothetical protein